MGDKLVSGRMLYWGNNGITEVCAKMATNGVRIGTKNWVSRVILNRQPPDQRDMLHVSFCYHIASVRPLSVNVHILIFFSECDYTLVEWYLGGPVLELYQMTPIANQVDTLSRHSFNIRTYEENVCNLLL